MNAQYHQLLSCLQEAAKNRNQDPDWVATELRLMHEKVSQLRAEAGKEPLPISEVQRVESLACGHSDYAHKFAFYCSELVGQP